MPLDLFSKCSNYLKRDTGNTKPSEFKTVEAMCDRIRRNVVECWNAQYKYILSVLRHCTINAHNRIDYQLILIESLKYPYAWPIIKDPNNNEVGYIYGGSEFNDIPGGEGNIIEISKKQNELILLVDMLEYESEFPNPDYVKVKYKFNFTNYEDYNLKIIKNEEFQAMYEIPLIDHYRKYLKIKNKEDKRCLIFDSHDAYCTSYILFDNFTKEKIQ